ncbi:hypothetical protein V496_00358, partial [Pseudogymnoascus sp. VKM F-4515 (FW-2607)]
EDRSGAGTHESSPVPAPPIILFDCTTATKVTTLLCRSKSTSRTPIVDVLCQPHLAKREDLDIEGIDWPAMFEEPITTFDVNSYNFVCGGVGASVGAAKEKGNRDNTLITREDEVMLIDEIILLALYVAVEILGILQYYPASSAAIKTNALASGSERRWRRQWAYAINDEFLNSKDIYIDIGKQVTSPTALLPSLDSEDSNAETYLYRKCCLESFTSWWRTATANASASSGSGAGTADVGGQTIEANAKSYAFKSGYVYSQFYNVIKAPFDAAKLYPFTNDGLENLALDPDYIKGLYKAGGATAFSQDASLKSYIYSKTRASANITSSVLIALALRALQHTYSSSARQTSLEPILYKDKWKTMRGGAGIGAGTGASIAWDNDVSSSNDEGKRTIDGS